MTFKFVKILAVSATLVFTLAVPAMAEEIADDSAALSGAAKQR